MVKSRRRIKPTLVTCGGFRPATTPNGEQSPVKDPNGSRLDVVSYFARLLSCATCSVQDLPDSRIKPEVSVLITSEECVPSVPLPGWSHVCWVEHVDSSLFSTTGLKRRRWAVHQRGGCLPGDVHKIYAALSGYNGTGHRANKGAAARVIGAISRKGILNHSFQFPQERLES